MRSAMERSKCTRLNIRQHSISKRISNLISNLDTESSIRLAAFSNASAVRDCLEWLCPWLRTGICKEAKEQGEVKVQNEPKSDIFSKVVLKSPCQHASRVQILLRNIALPNRTALQFWKSHCRFAWKYRSRPAASLQAKIVEASSFRTWIVLKSQDRNRWFFLDFLKILISNELLGQDKVVLVKFFREENCVAFHEVSRIALEKFPKLVEKIPKLDFGIVHFNLFFLDF